jgi:hypothetical protein
MNILQFFQTRQSFQLKVTALVITPQTCASETIRKKITLPAASKLLLKDRHAELINVLVHRSDNTAYLNNPPYTYNSQVKLQRNEGNKNQITTAIST